jgi:putative DNA primase/helicase
MTNGNGGLEWGEGGPFPEDECGPPDGKPPPGQEPTAKQLPTIEIVPGQIGLAVRQTMAALIDAKQPVFVRAGKLVKPVRAEMQTAEGGKTEVVVLRPMTAANLAVMLTDHAAAFVQYDRRVKKPMPIDPPGSVLQALVQLGEWEFPHVAGIVNAPTMRYDGSILTEPGYDPMTALWYAPAGHLVMPPVPDVPTKEDAEAALQVLVDLLREYPHVGDLDRSVSLSAILTAVTRGAYDLTPMFLWSAPAPGTGKSHLVDLVSLIARGRLCPVITVGKTADEAEKRLGSLLLEGPAIISLDNCSQDLEGDLLCQMTERPLVKVRILGESQTPECQWRGMLLATGNNVSFAGEMHRRGLRAELDAKVETPEQRKFYTNPHDLVRQDRGKYVAAALTVARAYLTGGEKADCTPIGSYGSWSRFAREPLVWLNQDDPVKSMEKSRKADPERNAAKQLVNLLRFYFKVGEGFTSKQIIKGCEDKYDEDTKTYKPGWTDLRELLTEQCSPVNKRDTIDPVKLGWWLHKVEGRVYLDDGGKNYRIVAKKQGTHANKWEVEEVEEPDQPNLI